jgi:uncharacterized membrane protein YbaN (DUF454 family)
VKDPPSHRVRTTAKKVALLLVGWGFILAGIVGMILPVLPGVVFMIVGLLILSSEYVWASDLLQEIRARFPALSSRVNEAATRASKWTGKSESKENAA